MSSPPPTHDAERAKWDEYYATLPLIDEGERMRAFNTELVTRISELLPAGGRVLEAGCGGGWQSLGLARAGQFQTSVLDFSPAALDYVRRLFAREHARVELMQGDVFEPGKPEFDLVFNAGVLEHYELDDQVRFLRGMASRSRQYVLVLVPNRECYWYWVWRIHNASRGEWPFGKEVPLTDLSAAFTAAGMQFLGQCWMGREWAEHFIDSLTGIDPALRQEILQIHRAPIVPPQHTTFLTAALGTLADRDVTVPAIWQTRPPAQDELANQLRAMLADTLALAVGAEQRVTQAEQRVAQAAEHTRQLQVTLDGIYASRTWNFARRLSAIYTQLRRIVPRAH